MEILDIYDKYRQKTGRTLERGNPMKEGYYHIVVHLYILKQKAGKLILYCLKSETAIFMRRWAMYKLEN